ncbi:MAG: ATPase [Chloroflexi bacterium]|nr:ATPase [Chloroflexota bacterium]
MAFDPTALAILGGAIGLAGGMAGSSIGVGIAASAGAGTLAEEPGQFRNVILLSSLPMTQTFYALIVLILIITTVVPKIAGMPDPGGSGLAVLGCGIFVASTEGFSAAYQGVICASGISLLPKTKGKLLTTTMILAVLVELWGILGIVFSVLTLSLLGLF